MKRVSYEQAKALKELGFPQEDYEYVYLDGDLTSKEEYDEYDCGGPFSAELAESETINAPELGRTAEWLREVKNVHIVPNFCSKAHKYEPIIYLPNEDKTYFKVMIPTYMTYEEAISIGIDTVIMSLKE